jgi:hypothetical protein
MFFARAMPSQSNNKSQNLDLRQMAPAVDPAAITIMLCTYPVARMERSVIRERSIGLIADPGFHFVPSGLQTK